MRIVLCDDDKDVLNLLKKYLQEYFHSCRLAQPAYSEYMCGEELLRAESRGGMEKVDIAFLDVEMLGLSGIHTGARLKKLYPKIKIFIVTSYPDYLDEAMRFHVFRYLSKPVDKKRLFRNMKDALYQLSIDTREVSIETKEQTVMISSRLMTSQSSLETFWKTRWRLRRRRPIHTSNCGWIRPVERIYLFPLLIRARPRRKETRVEVI